MNNYLLSQIFKTIVMVWLSVFAIVLFEVQRDTSGYIAFTFTLVIGFSIMFDKG